MELAVINDSVAFWMGLPDLQSIIEDAGSSRLLVEEILAFLENRRSTGSSPAILVDEILRATVFAHVAHNIAEHFRSLGDEENRQWYFAAGQELIVRQIDRFESLAVALGPTHGSVH